jgi:hypothetical protein
MTLKSMVLEPAAANTANRMTVISRRFINKVL